MDDLTGSQFRLTRACLGSIRHAWRPVSCIRRDAIGAVSAEITALRMHETSVGLGGGALEDGDLDAPLGEHRQERARIDEGRQPGGARA